MAMFNRKSEPAAPIPQPVSPAAISPPPRNGTITAAPSGGLLSRGVSIKGSVKFLNELRIDGEVEGTIDSPGKLSIGEHAQIKGEIRARSVNVRGNVEGDIFATERCELGPGCSLHGAIEAPRLVVDENAAFVGSAKVAMPK
jgi:cytoskeletal protein CcmA (bactofilin family)